MSVWGRDAFFFPVDRGFVGNPDNAAWSRQPDRDVLLVILRDAHTSDSDTVRVSLPMLQERTAATCGNRRVVHGRKALRGSLHRLHEDGLLMVPGSALRRSQGRAQGHFVVKVANYTALRLNRDGAGHKVGREAGHKRGTSGAHLDEREEGKAREQNKVRGRADDLAEWFRSAWSQHAPDLPAIRRLSENRLRGVRGLLREAGDDRQLVERAVAAFGRWVFAREKQLTVDTFLRAKNRDKNLEWAESGPPSSNGSAARRSAGGLARFAAETEEPNRDG